MSAQRDLRGSVVVITGASSGIGKAAAHAFARAGANVVLAARRPDPLEATARECRALGVEALAVPTDTGDAAAVRRLAERAIDAFGGFDVWINNASSLMFGALDQIPPAAYERLFDVNFFGYVNGARAALEHFRERGRGVLINNASLFARMPTGYTNAYTATKQAVQGFTDALRQELVPERDIHVVKILPAGIDTPILEHAANYTGRSIQPLYPLLRPERVAATMVDCARRPRREAIVGRIGRVHAWLYGLVPSWSDRLYGMAAARALKKATPKPSTDGNVFTPMPEGTETSGGLRRAQAKKLPVVVGAITVSGAVLAALRARLRHDR